MQNPVNWKEGRWFVAGHKGLAGGAILRALLAHGVPMGNILIRSRDQMDLRNKLEVHRFFEQGMPDFVVLAAAVVGGIEANRSYPVPFLKDNLEIQNNVIEASHLFGVRKLLFLGSSCIYPRSCPQPMKPEHLLTGALEPTNQWYAIAKIAGIKLCQAYFHQFQKQFISVMPTNLYGLNDNYHLQNSHVLPALIRKFHEAAASNSREVVCWGDGTPMREFLFSEDFAEACLFAMQHYSKPEILNVGSSSEISIHDLATKIAKIVGFHGKIVWDTSKPNGSPRKLMDSSILLDLGWKPRFSLDEGIRLAWLDFSQGFKERSNSNS